jgi:predicted DNA-binding protein
MKKRMTFTLDEEILEQLKKVSDETMIPQARLVEKAIKEIIENHNKKPLS